MRWWRDYETECAEWCATLSQRALDIMFDDGICLRLRSWR